MKIQTRLLSILLCMVLIVSLLPVTVSAADDFTEVLAEAKKGVVQLYGIGFNKLGKGISWVGSGFAIGEEGEETDIFLTNRHVVTDDEYPENIRIWILQENCELDEETGEPDPNKSIPCEVVKTTSGYPDYAIIRAARTCPEYKPMPLMSSKDIPDGTKVYALGYPAEVRRQSVNHYGIDDMTITDGIVSQHMQMSNAGDTWVLLHTAKITGGNSGGPLITEDGYVVGLNTYGIGDEVKDRSCAVYIDYAMDTLDDLDLPYEKIEDGGKKEKDTELNPILIGGGAAVVCAAVALVIAMKKKQEREEAERRRQEEEYRRREEEQRRMEEERRRMEAELRRREDDQRRREEEQRRRAQETRAQLRHNGGGVYPVPAAGCIIGRERDCGITLPEGTAGVSRHHCRLEFRSGQLILTDLNSSYGTYIHGKRVPPNTPVALKSGSSFCLGSENCKFTVC